MIEMNILERTKVTENKLRWDACIEETIFSLYIPKWRVPKPIPAKIIVELFLPPLPGLKRTMTPKLATENPELCRLPILSIIEQHSPHSKTIRYDPIGDPKNWEIGSPYIPISLLQDNNSKIILICVQWV